MQLPPKRPQRFRHRRRKKEPVLGAESVATALEGLGLTDYAQRLRIQIAWREAVGPEIAARTLPGSFSRGTLVVRTKSAAWANELTFLAADIVDRLNAALGRSAVKELKIQAGHIPPPPDRGPPAWSKTPLSKPEAQAVEATAAAIDDPDVRAAFERAMSHFQRLQRGPSTKARTSGEKV
jgi:hypothetical protein